MFIYPQIVSWMTSYSFALAKDSTYSSMSGYFSSTAEAIKDHAIQQKLDNKRGTYGDMAVAQEYNNFFRGIINNRTFTTNGGKTFNYSTVAPAAALRSILLVAGECLNFADRAKIPGSFFPDFGAILKGLLCALLVLFVGIFALLEYLMAFIEFMFISSVGIILFPLSLWEGTKFMAEKYINAMLGFFIKLLFCTVCIFFMLYGYLSIARAFTEMSFTGAVDQILLIVFSSLLFFYICKSAPGLAQSLLTGAPSLSAAGAIKTVASAVGTAAAVGTMGANLAGAGARGVLSATGAVAQGQGAYNAASDTVKAEGGDRRQQFAAGMHAFSQSMGEQTVEAVQDKGSDLMRSLLSRPLIGRPSHGRTSDPGVNPNTATQVLLKNNEDGSRRTLEQFYAERKTEGSKTGYEVGYEAAHNIAVARMDEYQKEHNG
jgi:hypothetical protein